MDRSDRLLSGLNKSMAGLEIGPFYAPIAPKAAGWHVKVVDFAGADQLRQVAADHPAENIRSEVHLIEEVDLVWSGQPLDELCSENIGSLDFVIASHVIEHTPDLISFLRQCSRLLRESGVISLAVPDLRRCFDMLKTPTGTREVLTAYREGRTRHTPETLYEARAYGTQKHGSGSWVVGDKSAPSFAATFDHAVDMYRRELAQDPGGPYVDAHAWHFTPASFRLVMLELNAMGIIDFEIEWLEETRGAEFLTHLRRSRARHADSEMLQQERMKLALERYEELLGEIVPPPQPPRQAADLSKTPTIELLVVIARRVRQRLLQTFRLA